MQKLDLHIHTSETSPCAVGNAANAVRRYVEKGYHGFVITDHFQASYHESRLGTLDQVSWEDRIDFFWKGYRAARDAAPENFLVLPGMEIRFEEESSNDYLLFGMNEQFLYDAPRDLDTMGIQRFSALVRQHGFLLIQAHPFRRWSRIIPTELLDGIEVYNGNVGHNSSNDIAQHWAEKYGFLRTSGSDFHGESEERLAATHPGGVLLQNEIHDIEELVEVLKSGNYELIL